MPKKRISIVDLAKQRRKMQSRRAIQQSVPTGVYDSRSPSQPPLVSIKEHKAQMKIIRKQLFKRRHETDKHKKQREKLYKKFPFSKPYEANKLKMRRQVAQVQGRINCS